MTDSGLDRSFVEAEQSALDESAMMDVDESDADYDVEEDLESQEEESDHDTW